jgi:tRNA-dihydrouridine synthase
MPKIFKNGEGSALLGDMPLAERIIKECKKAGKPVSVKIRIGWDDANLVTKDFAKMCEDAGADMLTIHGRTREAVYSGPVNIEEIASAKAAVNIPVIANGGIFSRDDAEKLLSETGADGVAIARGAMYNPFIFADITGKKVDDKKSVIKWQLDKTFELYDQHFAIVYMRKMIAFYIKGMPNASQIKVELFKANSREKIEEIFKTLIF